MRLFDAIRLRRHAALLATALLVAAHSTSLAQAPSADFRDMAKAPPSWGQFAKLVRYRFEEWIGADDTTAMRLRAYLKIHRNAPDGPPQTLIVKAWINPDGTVERVSFPALADAGANKDLQTILKRGNIGEAPPPELLQPINLRFSLNIKD